MSEGDYGIENPMRLSLTTINESLKFLRSNSTQIPYFENLSNCLDFVPKLKPKKIDSIPSPMNLDSKNFKKSNKHHSNLSCPDRDTSNSKFENYFSEMDDQVTEIEKFSLEKDENQLTDDDQYFLEDPPRKKSSLKEEAKRNFELKILGNEYETEKLKKPNDLKDMSRIFANLAETEDDEFSLNRDNRTDYEESNCVDNQIDEYDLIKAASYEAPIYEFHKKRANSILRTLEAGCKNYKLEDN